MAQRIRVELAICTIFVILSAFVIVVVSGYDDPMQEQYKTLRSSFVPILWASILGSLALIHAISQLLQARGMLKKEPIAPDASETASALCGEKERPIGKEDRKKITIMVLVTAVAMLVYCLLLFEINFILNTFWLLAVTFYTYGERNILKTGIISAVGAVGLWALFDQIMQVPL